MAIAAAAILRSAAGWGRSPLGKSWAMSVHARSGRYWNYFAKPALFSAKIARTFGGKIGGCRPDGDILRQFGRIDLIQRIVGGMMRVEIIQAVLARIDDRYAQPLQRRDIGTGEKRWIAPDKDAK